MDMENAEEVLQSLGEFAKLKPKHIPRELEDYLSYVAKTGDPVYQWSIVKCLFREKLLNVITEFYENTPTIDLPPCPNVDPFSYETMKNSLLERLDSFPSAPFTVQRLCELLTTPRKEYSRADKFMRAIEKNILVVSTREPGNIRRSDNNGQPELLMNGVMDGRGIELGEAIETVSSDGVNLMHAEENEVNVTENENMPVECSGMEDVDMEDQSENSNACNSNTWDKEHSDVSHQNEDGDKSSKGSEEVGNKSDSSEENISNKGSESNVPEKAAAEKPADSSVTVTATADVKTLNVSKESCKESESEMAEVKEVAVDVNSADQIESQDSSSEKSSEKTLEKESDAVTEEPVEETAPKKDVLQEETPVLEVDSNNSEEVPSTESSCSSVEKENETSTTTEAADKVIDSPSEPSATVDTKDEVSTEMNATSPSANTTAKEIEVDKLNVSEVDKLNMSEVDKLNVSEVDKLSVSAETSIAENETEETQVTKTKDDADASCSTPEKQETEQSKQVDSRDEENETMEDLEVKEGIAPTSKLQTENTEQEEAMEVETTPPAVEETQHSDEPMDQTEQPSEVSEEEGKS